jgi:hypothetical protein
MFLKNGFQDFIAKPIDIQQLDVVLNKWIRDKYDPSTLLMAEKALEAESADKERMSYVQSFLLAHDIDGLNMAEGLRRYDDSADIYISILKSYMKSAPSLLKEINFLTGVLSEYAIKIHGFKGASYGICAYRAGKLAEELECAAKASDEEFVRARHGDFMTVAEKLLSDMTQLFDKLTPTAQKDIREEQAYPDKTALRDILDACVNFQTSRLKKSLLDLEKYKYRNQGELVEWLREQADNLEYEKIQKHLEKILTEEGPAAEQNGNGAASP